MPNPSDEKMPPLAAVAVVGETDDDVTRFWSMVEANGASLVPLGTEPAGAAVVVIIKDSTITVPPDEIPLDREVLPVSLGATLSPLFPQLSHLMPAVIGWDAAAEKLADTIRYGGQGLLEWARLVNLAREWVHDRSSPPLTVTEQASAVSALGSQVAADHRDGSELVRAYLAGSTAYTRRVRRAASAVLTAVAAVLVAAIVLATTQAIGAKVAGDLSLEQSNNATAVRISSEAVAGIGSDPDLPMLLSERALELSASPTVRNAVGAVAASAVAHASYSLDAMPWDLGVSDDGHSAVASYETSTIELLTPTGEVERVIRYRPESQPWQAASVALSPDGSTLVAMTVDGISVFSTADGSPSPGLIPHSGGWQPGTWSGSDRLLVTGTSGAAILDTSTAELDALAGSPEGAAITGMSQDGAYFAAATDSGLQVIATSSGNVVHATDLAGITGLAVSDDGSMVVAKLQFGVQLIRWKATGGDPDTRSLNTMVQPAAVVSLGPEYFAIAWIDGWVSIVAAAPSASHYISLDNEIVRFPAHAEGHVSIASTRSGDLITAGFDRYLRVWDTGGLDDFWRATTVGVTTPSGAILPGITQSGEFDAFPAAAINNQIRYTSDGRIALALRSAASVLSLDGLDDPKPQGSFLGMFGRPFLSDDGRSVVTIGSSDPWVVRVQKLSPTPDVWVDPEPTLSFETTMPVQSTGVLLSPTLAAVSGDGRSVAIVSSTGVRTWSSTSGDPLTTTFDTPSTPLAAVVDVDGARAVTSDGMLHEPDGSSQNLIQLLRNSGEKTGGIVAGAFDGNELLVLADTGALASVTGGKARIILAPGMITAAGTLRISPDGKLIAAVGPDRVTLIDPRDKLIIGHRNNVAGIRVDDVAFSPDGKSLAMVSATSQVALVPVDDFTGTAGVVAPRLPTEDENLLYTLGITSG